MTPYYEHAGVTIFHGDSGAIYRLFAADSLVTDPPYGFGLYRTDILPTPQLLLEMIRAFPTAAVFGYPEELIRFCVDVQIVPDEWITWSPVNRLGGFGKHFPRTVECIAIWGETWARSVKRPRAEDTFCRKLARSRGLGETEAQERDIWFDPKPAASCNHHLRLHPNEKPISLMGKLIQTCSQPGAMIFDPYCGSGSTLVAAKRAGRRAIGIEIEERYCAIAAARLEQEVLPIEEEIAAKRLSQEVLALA